ncbi:hypothetical protein Poli38472_007530 [Pythium oligandrum]|uniref:Uncharacterized protein n=1 Tax=Pythium oligandrum TaxID=41045 RepID=A0A8K1FRS2_PYTOL|nr:hypothetical protein Poli38472_007530 [Pythium oligandrum]|eukprot:TMW67858.1 hypothetical protein Poli38472_007530 [Pythium oligandrum]
MTDPDDMLADVLAFLDEYATSEAVNPQDDALNTCPDGGEAVKTKPKPRRQETLARRLCRNRGRERQRLELLELRHETHVLSARLMQMQKKNASRRRAAACGDAQTHQCALEMTSVWHELASRQKQRRQAAEEERARLRARVVEQQHVIKSLQRILARYSADAVHSPTASSRLYAPAWRAMCADGDPLRMMQIFADLVVDVKQAHERTALWLPTHWSSSLTNGRYRDSRVTQLSPTQLMIETVNLRLMPFPYRKAGLAYWDGGVNHHCAKFDYFREGSEVEGRETVFCGQAFHDGSGDDGVAMFRLCTHMSIQRFEENDRLIVVNAARSDSIRINGHELRDVHVKEQYWNVFQSPETMVKDACLMTSFGRVIMEVAGGLNQSPLAVLGATNFFGDRIHLHLNAAVSSVEDTLLDAMVL